MKKITLPNLGEITELGRREPFSVFIPRHAQLAGLLIRMFMSMRNIEELQSFAVYTRDRVNPFLFNYALSVAILHRPDTHGMSLPNFMETFPEKYIDGAVFGKAREEATIVPNGSRVSVFKVARGYGGLFNISQASVSGIPLCLSPQSDHNFILTPQQARWRNVSALIKKMRNPWFDPQPGPVILFLQYVPCNGFT